jgi:hypothetical protein
MPPNGLIEGYGGAVIDGPMTAEKIECTRDLASPFGGRWRRFRGSTGLLLSTRKRALEPVNFTVQCSNLIE